VDAEGNTVPPIRFDDQASPLAPIDVRFPVRPEGIERAHPAEVEGSYAPDAQTQREQQAALNRREIQRGARDTAERRVDTLRDELGLSDDQVSSAEFDQTVARLRSEHAGNPETLRTIDALVRERRRLAEARHQVSQESMRIGQLMADSWVRERYPNARLLHGGVGSASRPGDFDAVYLVSQGEGQRPLILIVEAKGGAGTLGTRQVGGRREQQGTRAYMLEIARLMAMDPNVSAQTQGMMDAVQTGNADVRYVLIEAPITTTGGRARLEPGRVSEFNIAGSP